MIPYSKDWFELRKTKVGASDMPIIMGTAPKYWGTPQTLWMEKKGLRERKMNPAMKRGHELEPLARLEASERLGMELFAQVVFNDEQPWLMVTLDGLSLDGQTLLEIKCVGKEDHNIAFGGQVPKKHWPQLQAQLLGTKLNKGYYGSYYENSLILVDFVRDEEYINEMIPKGKDFWDCLNKNILPDGAPDDYELRLDDLWIEHARAVREARAKIKELEEQEEHHRQLLIEMANERNCCGGGVLLRRTQTPGRINYKAIPELSRVDLDRYRGQPTSHWTLNLEDR